MGDRQAFYIRVLAAAALLAGAALALGGAARNNKTALLRPLAELPLAFGPWRGIEVPMEARIIKAVGVDEYLNRGYAAPDGTVVDLYIGFYSSQRTGEWVHSPKNCLPSAGWEPLRVIRLPIRLADGRTITVNEYLIAKGLNRKLVLYWYHGRGRAIASEYASKLWLAFDSLTRHRTDVALVRAVATVGADEAAATRNAVGFVQAVYPQLSAFFPN